MITQTSMCTLSFHCAVCDERWDTDYQVRTARFASGTEIETYVLDGSAVTSPISGATCRRCGAPSATCCGMGPTRSP
jgi:hypothetical protein